MRHGKKQYVQESCTNSQALYFTKGGGGQVPEFDMEVTDERFDYMKNLLVRLYADQIGMDVKSIKVRPANKETKEPA